MRSKQRDIKNELHYLWLFYKWQILAGIMAFVMVLAGLAAVLGKKETALCVMLIDSHSAAGEAQMERDCLAALGEDLKKKEALFVTSLLFDETGSAQYAMTSLSRFLADIGSAKLDVCAMTEADFVKYDSSDTWMDLEALLGREELEALGDAALVRGGRVIGLYADASPVLRGYGCYTDGSSRGVIGVVYNTGRANAARDYLSYLYR